MDVVGAIMWLDLLAKHESETERDIIFGYVKNVYNVLVYF